MPKRLPVVVLISGRGSNLQAFIDATATVELPIDIRAVISNRPGALGLERARCAGISTESLDHKTFADRSQFDAALLKLISCYRPRLVLLAGFMRILTPQFVNHFHGCLFNIHPSLLPDFPGLHTHERALQAGVKYHGASVHFVTNELDGGPVVLQARVPVLAGDDPQTIAARVLPQEHLIYPLAVRWFAEGRLRLAHGVPQLDGAPMSGPIIYGHPYDKEIADTTT
jgi:phosphoribosylglycinamide formyltransferase-1